VHIHIGNFSETTIIGTCDKAVPLLGLATLGEVKKKKGTYLYFITQGDEGMNY
jgi:hypothetical protein